jgi:histidine ammonia-lyase
MLEILLDGETLAPDVLWAAAQTALNPKGSIKVRLSEPARQRISKSAGFVDSIVAEGKPVYGINTGFGKFAEVRISDSQLAELQKNLILSHACGVGPALSRDLVMAMWLIRLNVIARGNSGVRMETVEHIIAFLEKGVLAEVPCQGSVGASGDLAPSAHATLPLLGEGFCTYAKNGAILRAPVREVMADTGLTAIELGPKEGLGLINGTQLTTAYAVKACLEARNLLKTANLSLALMMEGLQATHVLADERILKSRNQPGAEHCGQELRAWLGGGSAINQSHADCGQVQDPYSLRCAPQVHGAVWEEIERAWQTVARELNSSTDNPLLFADDKVSLSGGNFHAIYTARVCDALASALATLSNISERRLALAMSKSSNKLHAFLVVDGGLNSGFMMAQVTAAALVSESKTLSFPASVDSIPTSDDREDHVSMGPIAGRKLQQIAENTRQVLAIEVMAACQAIDLLRPLKSTSRLEKVHARVRKDVAFLDHDRILSTDFEALSRLIASGQLLEQA